MAWLRNAGLAVLVVVGCLGAFQALAAEADQRSPSEQAFAPLLGSWTAEGAAFGAPAKSRMAWSMTLGGKIVQLNYRIDMETPKGSRTFEGVGKYRADAPDAFTGQWADNGGDLHRIVGSIEGGAFQSIWGEAGAKRGKTLYRVQTDGTVEVIDWIEQPGGAWKEFNRQIFKRSPN